MHGVNQRERLIPMSVYRKELAKARRMTLKLGFAVVTPRLKTRQKKGI